MNRSKEILNSESRDILDRTNNVTLRLEKVDLLLRATHQILRLDNINLTLKGINNGNGR